MECTFVTPRDRDGKVGARKLRVRKSWLAFAVLAIAIVGAFTVWSVGRGAEAGEDEASPGLRTVLEVISLIKTQYVDDVDTVALIGGYLETGTINGMLREAIDDPYTRFMDARAFQQMQIDTQGEYGGIGITVALQDGKLTIIAPFEGTPGHAAGLRSGDTIVSIDGKPTEYMSLDEAVSLMRGPEGSPIRLGIQRRDQEPFEVEIVRAIIQVPSVTRTEVFPAGTFPGQRDRIGYIRLQRFSERTNEEMEEALRRLEREEVAGIILDLRDNPGGTLEAAIDVANKFLSNGPILHIVARNQQRRTISAFPRGTHPPHPMVVLVNGYSASASEIVAGALQDHGRAQLVGTTTFGKGLVQTIVPLRDGSALSLTSARYQTAGGRFIHETGIEPDHIVEWPQPEEDEEIGAVAEPVELDEDPQFLKAVEVLGEMIREASRQAG